MPTRHTQKQTLYSHRNLAGCVLTRKNQTFGTPVSVYHAEQAEVDAPGSKYITVCETHGTFQGATSLKQAVRNMTEPDGWCDCCAEQMSYQVITHANTERSKK